MNSSCSTLSMAAAREAGMETDAGAGRWTSWVPLAAPAPGAEPMLLADMVYDEGNRVWFLI